MIPALVALLAAPAQVTLSQAATTPPPNGHAPPVIVTGPSPDDAEEAAKTVAQIQDMYDVSCAAREYGAYDDVCNQLNQQLKEARRDAERKARAADRRKATAPK